jgi:hypothetical protein
MKTATIPADSQWHDLPERPVRSIISPTLLTEIDLLPDGTGRVRVTQGDEPVEVEYTAGEAYSLPLSSLIDPSDPPELRPENAEGWNHGGQ